MDFCAIKFNFVAWHLYDTALLTTLAGMWLVAISPFFTTPSIIFNTLANDFFLTSLPSIAILTLVFRVLSTPGAIS